MERMGVVAEWQPRLISRYVEHTSVPRHHAFVKHVFLKSSVIQEINKKPILFCSCYALT